MWIILSTSFHLTLDCVCLGRMALALGPLATGSAHIKVVKIIGFVNNLHCKRDFLIT